MAETRKPELVFIPNPGLGHLVSMVELAKLLLAQNHNLCITILIITRSSDTNILSYKKSLTESKHSGIKYLDLRPDPSNTPIPFHHYVDAHKSHVREIFAEMSESKTSKPAGMIVDMFCLTMFDVAHEFKVPAYLLYTSGAAILGLMLHLQSLRDEFNEDVSDYNNSKTEISVPTYINPVPTNVLPSLIFDKEGGSRMFLNQAKRYREAKGIIINTFRELEPLAFEALEKDKTIPPVYPIGPMLSLNKELDPQEQAIVKWLDLQPDSSVVYLCFGSAGAFDEAQVKETAIALEQSGHRFLWSLRKPPPQGQMGYPEDYGNLDEVLPEGFLTRTSGTGKIVGWAPQAAILAHPAVGGFVSHCGWNSVLESVWFGVPLAAWPLYAEQQVNAFQLVKDLGMAAEIKMDYRKQIRSTLDLNSEDVSAEVIEKGIRLAMEPDSEVRKKVKEMQEKSRAALVEGGSSYVPLRSFIDDVFSNV